MAFTKRVYSTKSKIFIYGGGTLTMFISLLLSLSYLGVNVETSGDITCSGTKDNPCISYFNISLSNYSLCLGSTFKGLYFDQNATAEIFKADLRYRSDNPERWKIYNFTAGKCLEKNKKHEFMIKGYKQPEETIKWALNIQGKDVDPYWIGEKKTQTDLLISSEIGYDLNWNIETSGIEKNLQISYINIDENTTEFCIDFINKTEYEKDLSEQDKDIKDVPLQNNGTNGSLTIEKAKIDLSGKNNCFNVDYPEQKEGLKFKIGTESVIITSTFDTDATEGVGKNIVRDKWGGLDVVYTSAGNDFGFARSTNNGSTWTAIEMDVGTYDDFGIVTNSTGGLLIYYRTTADIIGRDSTNNGTTWAGGFIMADMTNTLEEPSCDVDSNNVIHCCAVDSADDVYYFNSSAWDTETLIYSGPVNTLCSLAINVNNTIAIFHVENSADNASVTYQETGGAWTRMQIYKGSGADFPNPPAISISQAYPGFNDMFLTIGNVTNTMSCIYEGAWFCDPILGSNRSFLASVENDRGDLVVLSGSQATAGGTTKISNSTTWNPTVWTSASLNTAADFPSIADQVWPTTAKMDNIAHIVYTNATGVFYTSYTVYVPGDTTPPTYSLNSTNSTEAGYSVQHRVNWADNTALSGYIFSFNNGTGILTNDSWVSMIGITNWSNITKTINDTYNVQIQWKVYANDSSNNWNATSTFYYNTTDTIFPRWSSNSTNSTLAGTQIEHSLYWTEGTSLSGYIFSFANGTSTFVNDSFVPMIGKGNWSNVTKGVNTTVSANIQWKVYANDSANNMNVSSAFSYNTTETDITPPLIDFTNNFNNQSSTSKLINVSSNDLYNISTFIDFDGSLMGWWRMDDANSSHIFDYLSKNNGTIYEATQNNSGKLGKSFNFDGTNDYFNMSHPTSLDNMTELTYSMWVYPRGYGGNRGILTKGNQKEWYFNATGGLIGLVGCAGAEASSETNIIPLNQWNYVAMTYSNSGSRNVTAYVNGISDSLRMVSCEGTILRDDDPALNPDLVIGTWALGSPFNGLIDDVVIWNRSLSSGEILGIYANTSSRYLVNTFGGLSLGTHTFKAYSQDTNGNVNSTQTKNLTIEVATDTCTCPGSGNNWEVNMSHNCNMTIGCNLGTGNLTWIGISGYFNCSAQLNLTNRNAPPSNTIFYFSNGCQINR